MKILIKMSNVVFYLRNLVIDPIIHVNILTTWNFLLLVANLWKNWVSWSPCFNREDVCCFSPHYHRELFLASSLLILSGKMRVCHWSLASTSLTLCTKITIVVFKCLNTSFLCSFSFSWSKFNFLAKMKLGEVDTLKFITKDFTQWIKPSTSSHVRWIWKCFCSPPPIKRPQTSPPVKNWKLVQHNH